MVRVGFIVEGDSEKILLESPSFRTWCESIGVEIVDPVINAGGGGNLLPKYLGNHLARLTENSDTPDRIVVLTDLEDEDSTEVVRTRILSEGFEEKIDVVFIAVKALEAWFLADTQAMRHWLNTPGFVENFPEKTFDKPFERVKEIAALLQKRGPGGKVTFARAMVSKYGFSIENAARHPHCPSAKKFYQTLNDWGSASHH